MFLSLFLSGRLYPNNGGPLGTSSSLFFFFFFFWMRLFTGFLSNCGLGPFSLPCFAQQTYFFVFAFQHFLHFLSSLSHRSALTSFFFLPALSRTLGHPPRHRVFDWISLTKFSFSPLGDPLSLFSHPCLCMIRPPLVPFDDVSLSVRSEKFPCWELSFLLDPSPPLFLFFFLRRRFLLFFCFFNGRTRRRLTVWISKLPFPFFLFPSLLYSTHPLTFLTTAFPFFNLPQFHLALDKSWKLGFCPPPLFFVSFFFSPPSFVVPVVLPGIFPFLWSAMGYFGRTPPLPCGFSPSPAASSFSSSCCLCPNWTLVASLFFSSWHSVVSSTLLFSSGLPPSHGHLSLSFETSWILHTGMPVVFFPFSILDWPRCFVRLPCGTTSRCLFSAPCFF